MKLTTVDQRVLMVFSNSYNVMVNPFIICINREGGERDGGGVPYTFPSFCM